MTAQTSSRPVASPANNGETLETVVVFDEGRVYVAKRRPADVQIRDELAKRAADPTYRYFRMSLTLMSGTKVEILVDGLSMHRYTGFIASGGRLHPVKGEFYATGASLLFVE